MTSIVAAGYVQVDSKPMPTDGTSITFTLDLASGQDYYLVARGSGYIQQELSLGLDAEFAQAAAAWEMASQDCALPETPLLELIADEDELLAVHALVAASRRLTQDSLPAALALMGTSSRRSAGIAKSILASPCDSVEIVA